MHFKVCLWQCVAGFFGPFDKAYRCGVEVFVQTRVEPFLRVVESIKIKVIQNIPRKYINFNQCIARALDRPCMAQGAKESAGERGLAGAKLADEVDARAWRQMGGERRTQSERGVVVGERDGMMAQ